MAKQYRPDGSPVNFAGDYDAYVKNKATEKERKEYNLNTFEDRFNYQSAGGTDYPKYGEDSGGGFSGGGFGGSSYNPYQEELERRRQALQASYGQAIGGVNAAALQGKRNAYLSEQQRQQSQPQQLASLGITGGGSETANMGAQAVYQNALNEIEQGKLAEIGRLEGDLAQGVAVSEGDYYARIAQQQEMQRQEQAAYERELELIQMQKQNQEQFKPKNNVDYGGGGGIGSVGSYAPNQSMAPSVPKTNTSTGKSPYLNDPVLELFNDPRAKNPLWLQTQKRLLSPAEQLRLQRMLEGR